MRIDSTTDGKAHTFQPEWDWRTSSESSVVPREADPVDYSRRRSGGYDRAERKRDSSRLREPGTRSPSGWTSFPSVGGARADQPWPNRMVESLRGEASLRPSGQTRIPPVRRGGELFLDRSWRSCSLR